MNVNQITGNHSGATDADLLLVESRTLVAKLAQALMRCHQQATGMADRLKFLAESQPADSPLWFDLAGMWWEAAELAESTQREAAMTQAQRDDLEGQIELMLARLLPERPIH